MLTPANGRKAVSCTPPLTTWPSSESTGEEAIVEGADGARVGSLLPQPLTAGASKRSLIATAILRCLVMAHMTI
jgi:hypothetical protein